MHELSIALSILDVVAETAVRQSGHVARDAVWELFAAMVGSCLCDELFCVYNDYAVTVDLNDALLSEFL